jgi:hypothetical protein
MTIAEMFGQGGTMLGVSVFLMIVILGLCISMRGKIIQIEKLIQDLGSKDAASPVPAAEALSKASAPVQARAVAPAQTQVDVKGPLIAAITAAVNEYRKDNN